jgi:hypothetical protein
MPIKIRREYPSFYAAASMWVATPLIALFASFYVTSAYTKPGSAVYPLGMAILGITLALAGVCFTVPESTDGSRGLYYAGEKFLHSALLLIQSVMLVYIKEEISGSGWWKQHAGLTVAVFGAIAGLFALTSGGAAVCWYWAFDAANRQMWANWKRKIESLSAEQTGNSAAPALEAADSVLESHQNLVKEVAPKATKA